MGSDRQIIAMQILKAIDYGMAGQQRDIPVCPGNL